MIKKKRVVTIGGGTGSFTLLSGLKNYPFDISAIVSMADDGGSTGRLRDELGVLPPGDVRQCLVALSEESKVLRDLFNYRFDSGQLKGHSLGNLFLSALEKMTGNFSKGLDEAMKVLKIKGKVVPVTDDNVNLNMELDNGLVLDGEEQINHDFRIQKIGMKRIFLSPVAKANPLALQVIKKADLIIIGPGNHYCSVVPNLLAKGISKAIVKSRARVFYVVNLVNKRGHTEGYSAWDYINSINSYLGKERVDYAIFNNKAPVKKIREKYEKKGEDLVFLGKRGDSPSQCKIISANVLSGKAMRYSKADVLNSQRALIRHDGQRLAQVISIICQGESIGKLSN